jgi:hypothetical protein
MSEYGVSLREIDEYWTPGRTLLYLRKITDRYERQSGKKKKQPRELTEAELLKSDWING